MCNLLHTLKLFESNKACFFLHVSNVLGVCRGMDVRSHASYAEPCVFVSVSIDFPLNSQRDAPFHRIAYYYSHADWDGLLDHLRDVP